MKRKDYTCACLSKDSIPGLLPTLVWRSKEICLPSEKAEITTQCTPHAQAFQPFVYINYLSFVPRFKFKRQPILDKIK